jgi:hypothetical protein
VFANEGGSESRLSGEKTSFNSLGPRLDDMAKTGLMKN